MFDISRVDLKQYNLVLMAFDMSVFSIIIITIYPVMADTLNLIIFNINHAIISIFDCK